MTPRQVGDAPAAQEDTSPTLNARFELAPFNQQFSRAVREAIQGNVRQIVLLEAARLRREARDQSSTEGRHGGTPWAPRKGHTRPADRWPLLRRTDRLYLSLGEEFHPEHVERLDLDQRGIPYLVFGTSVSYAGHHQYGTRVMPARPLLTPSMLGGTSHAQFPL